MNDKIDEVPEPSTLWIASKKPAAFFDTPEASAASTMRYLADHPTPPEIEAMVGRQVVAVRTADAALHIAVEGSPGLHVTQPGSGGPPEVAVTDDPSPPLGASTLARELRTGWCFPHGPSGEETRERSRPYTSYRSEALERMVGLHLEEVTFYPHMVGLYFEGGQHLLALDSVFEAGTWRPIIHPRWLEWDGRMDPGGRPSTWV